VGTGLLLKMISVRSFGKNVGLADGHLRSFVTETLYIRSFEKNVGTGLLLKPFFSKEL